jgi:hypothetical protein
MTVWRRYMTGSSGVRLHHWVQVTDGLKEVHDKLQGSEGIPLGDKSLMVWRKYVTGCRGVRVHLWITSHWWLAGSTCPMTQEDLHVQQQHCESIKSCLLWINCQFLLFWSIRFRAFSNIMCCVIEEPCLMLLYVWCCLNMNPLSIYQHVQSAHLYTFVFWYSWYMFRLSTAILRQFIALCINHYISHCQFCNNVMPHYYTEVIHKSLNMCMQSKYNTPNCEIWFMLKFCSISFLMLLVFFVHFISVHSPDSEFKLMITWISSVLFYASCRLSSAFMFR